MNKEQKIAKEMQEQFLHWAKYNPTIVKEKFGVSVDFLTIIVSDILRVTFKK